jgi:hypothetical protein
MSILQAVMTAPLMSAAPTYTLTPPALNVNEGSSLTFTVGGTNIPNGTYYWTIETNAGDVSETSSSFTITGNSGSFSVTPTADATTEGVETFIVYLRSGSIAGPVLASETITINDTSLTPEPVPPFSLQFVQNEGDYLEAAASADWNLGTTWTIEFWLRADAASDTAGGGIWGLLNQGGWGATNSIVVALSDNKLVFLSVANNANDDVRYTEPASGQWTHVAIANSTGTQKVFYNGFEQTRVSGNVGTASYTNSTDSLRIGRLSPPNGGTLNGKMAMVRISNTAKYSAAFTPIVTYGVEADTKLFLGSDTPLVDSMSHTITNNGVVTSTVFINRYTATHSASNGGSTGIHIDSNPTNDAWAGSVPVGASIISQVTGRFTVNSRGRDSNNNWFFVVGGSNNFTAGETHTFIW